MLRWPCPSIYGVWPEEGGGSSAKSLLSTAAQDGRAPYILKLALTPILRLCSFSLVFFAHAHSYSYLPCPLLSKLQPLSSDHLPPPPPRAPLSGSASSNSRTPPPHYRLPPPARNSRLLRPLVLGLLKKTTAGGKMSIFSPKKQQMSDRAPSDCHA